MKRANWRPKQPNIKSIITREGEQLQTVGHHWPLDGPLTKDMRDHMERVGVCLSCHKEIPSGRFIYRIFSKAGDYLGLIPKSNAEHQQLINRAMFITANVELFGIVIVGIFLLALIIYFVVRRRES